MNVIYKNHIKNLINSFINGHDKSKNAIFVKHYNIFNIYEKDMRNILKDNDDIYLLYNEFNINKIKKAYEPVLDWIKELYYLFFQDIDLDTFLKECDTYPLHIPIIRSYMVTGRCFREEDIILTEINYEYEQFIESLVKILSYISLKIPLVMVLNKLHASGLSSIDFIKKIIENKYDNNILLIATYNEAYTVESYMQESWSELINKLEEVNILSEWELHNNGEMYYEKEIFIPKIEELKEYVVDIGNMLHMLATKQALYYLDIIYTKLEINKIVLDKNLKLDFLFTYVLANIYCDNMSKALLLCDNIRTLCNNESSKSFFLYNYITGLAQIYNKQFCLGKEFARKCKKIAEDLDSKYLGFKAELLNYMALFRGWRGLFLCEYNCSIRDGFIEDLKKYGYKNHLAYINLMGYENDNEQLSNIFYSEQKFIHFNRSLEIAKELKNYSFLLLAYNKMIILASCHEKYDIVEEYYGKSIEISKLINNKVEEGNVYKGLGYNLIVSESYKKSSENLSKAIEIFYSMNVIEDIAESLYNLGINCFTAMRYEDANRYFEMTLKIIDNLGIGTIKVCNISKIYGFIAICNYFLGVEYNYYLYFNKMRIILSHLLEPDSKPSFKLWDDDLFLYFLLKGLIEKREKKYNESKKSFIKAEYHMKVAAGSTFYSYTLLTSEKAKLYKELGENDKAENMLKKCISYCETKGYFNRAKFLKAQLKGEYYILNKEDLRLKFITEDQIINLSKKIGTERELEEQRKELSFLLLWQDTLNKESTSKEDLINNSMITIKNNFSIERILYINVEENNNIEVAYIDEQTKVNKKELKAIVKYFINNPREFVTCRNENNFEHYSELINIFGKNTVFSIIGIPILVNNKIKSILITFIPIYNNFTENKIPLNERNLYIFRYIFKQLLEEINKIKIHQQIEEINKQLHKSAITDVLTGVYNRKGFENKLDEENKKTTIIYVDLDNFKYYNDNFGHDIGDYVLILLSEIFKAAVYEKGYVVRYGGDEFILVVPNGTNEDGIEISEYILRLLDEDSNFFEDINKKIGRKVNHKLSCSIGVSTSKSGTKESIMRAIKEADEVLYEVKKSGKNNYKCFS